MIRSAVVAWGLASVAWAQEQQLKLDEAVRLAIKRNGSVQAAKANVEASKFNLRSAESANLPTVNGLYQWNNSQLNYGTGANRNAGTFKTNEHTSSIDGSYTIWDSGSRSSTIGVAKNSFLIQKLSAIQTIRQTILSVHTQYYDLLRAQELLRVNSDQQKRAEEILKYTKAKFEVGLGPKKDILQAEADALNSKSNVLVQQNRVDTSWQTLRATIGWDEETTPTLVATNEPPAHRVDFNQEDAYKLGLKRRPELQSSRASLDSAALNAKIAQMDARVQFSLDANARYAFGPDVFRRGGLVFNATVPLFDGARSKSVAQARSAAYRAQAQQLTQLEREARADIESTWRQYDQGFAILEASKAALAAAQENYRVAEFGARPDIGKSTLLEIRNAQVTLTTAEVNYVQALYDMLIADVRYRVAVGEALDGEDLKL